jgi:hypothetical protein
LRIIGVVGAHSSDPLESVTLEEIEGGCPIADALVLEAIAESLRSRADGPSAEALAAAAGCEVRYDPLAPIEGVLLLGRIIVVRPRHDPRAQELAVLHELSHAELDRSGLAHSHGDVWCLALALGAPMPLLRRVWLESELALAQVWEVTRLPAWAVKARLEMGAVLTALG